MTLKSGSTQFAWYGLAIIWIIYLIINQVIFLYRLLGVDFPVYYRASQALVEGNNLYYDMVNGVHLYIYPPLLAQLFAPIVAIIDDFRLATVAWFVISAAALIGLVFLLSSFARTRSTKISIWILPLLFLPVLQSLALGQVTIIMTFFTVSAWAAYRSGRSSLAGIFLMFITWIKIYPALLLLYFLWKREWRVIWSAAICCLVLVVFQIAVSGFDTFISYFRDVFPQLLVEGRLNQAHSNMSILGIAQKLFVPAPRAIVLVDSPLLMNVTRFGLSLLIVGIFVYLTTRPWQRLAKTPMKVFDLEYSLILMTALLLGSTLHLHGMVSLLLPMTVLIQEFSGQRLWRFRQLPWIAFAIVMINLHLFLMPAYLIPGSALSALLLLFPFLGMMILWIMVAYTLWQTAQSISGDRTEVDQVLPTISHTTNPM